MKYVFEIKEENGKVQYHHNRIIDNHPHDELYTNGWEPVLIFEDKDGIEDLLMALEKVLGGDIEKWKEMATRLNKCGLLIISIDDVNVRK